MPFLHNRGVTIDHSMHSLKWENSHFSPIREGHGCHNIGNPFRVFGTSKRIKMYLVHSLILIGIVQNFKEFSNLE